MVFISPRRRIPSPGGAYTPLGGNRVPGQFPEVAALRCVRWNDAMTPIKASGNLPRRWRNNCREDTVNVWRRWTLGQRETFRQLACRLTGAWHYYYNRKATRVESNPLHVANSIVNADFANVLKMYQALEYWGHIGVWYLRSFDEGLENECSQF